jgi:hypothetical protein
VDRPVVTKEEIRRAAQRSAKASARLEGRTVPKGFVRSPRVERRLAERREER